MVIDRSSFGVSYAGSIAEVWSSGLTEFGPVQPQLVPLSLFS